MTYQINFQQQSEVMEVADNKEQVILDALLLYEGEFTDAHGQKIKITPEVMLALKNNYDAHLSSDDGHHAWSAIRRVFGKEPKKRYKNISLDHKKGEVGKIVGKVLALEVRQIEGQSYLFGKHVILTKENVEKVTGEIPLWTEMSISFDYDDMDKTAELREVSYVFEPAIKNVMSFSSANTSPLQDTKISVELEACREDLGKLNGEKRRIEAEINKLQRQRSLAYQFNNMVKQGYISRSDFKKIMIDFQSIDDPTQESIVRAITTVARSRKATRGKVNSNFSSQVFENFVDNLQTPTRNAGDKDMTTKVDPEKLAASIIEAINGTNKTADLSAVPSDKKMTHGVNKEEKHEEGEYMIHFKKEDMHRLHGMVKMGKSHNEIMDCMKEMGYHGEEHDHSAAGAANTPHSEGMEYSKELKALDQKIVDMQKQLSENSQFNESLLNKIIELSKAPAASTEGGK